MGIRYLSEPKSKLRLPRVTMGLDKSLNQSPQSGLEKIGYTSSNGPRGNCCKVLNEQAIGHMLVGQNGGSTISHHIYDNVCLFNYQFHICISQL